MIHRVLVVGRALLERAAPAIRDGSGAQKARVARVAVIHQVSDPGTIPVDVGAAPHLALSFHDIQYHLPGYVTPSPEHARTIAEFVKALHADTARTMLVCACDAGVSRSGAIGLFANEAAGLDPNRFHRDNPHAYPNRWLLRLLGDANGSQPAPASCVPDSLPRPRSS